MKWPVVLGNPLKPVSHRTRLGTRFQYGILGHTRVDWYKYWAPTVPGDVLVRLRLECSTSMYEQSMDILDQARFVTVWTRFAKQFSYDCCRFEVRSSTVSYGLVRLNTTFYSINWTFTGLTYGPTDFCSSYARIITHSCMFWYKIHSFDGLASQIFEPSTEKV